jgi:hypothetical protein
VITTWLLLLASYGFAGLTGASLPSGNVVTAFEPVASDPLQFADFVQGVLHSISQVFLKGKAIVALIFLVGLAVNSITAAVFALGGRDSGRHHGASPRRGKRLDQRWVAGIQPRPDGNRRPWILPASAPRLFTG